MLTATLIIIVIILISFSTHEYAHGWMANRLGDPTARLEGRLSLNPIAHWDPLGTSLLVGLLLLRGIGLPVFVFGWGKPVPINENNFKNPRFDSFKTALAGPIVNLVLAIGLAQILYIPSMANSALAPVLVLAVTINIFLAIFNLLPVPPLDGSRILRIFLSDETYYRLEQFSSILIFGLLILILAFPNVLSLMVERLVALLVP